MVNYDNGLCGVGWLASQVTRLVGMKVRRKMEMRTRGIGRYIHLDLDLDLDSGKARMKR